MKILGTLLVLPMVAVVCYAIGSGARALMSVLGPKGWIGLAAFVLMLVGGAILDNAK